MMGLHAGVLNWAVGQRQEGIQLVGPDSEASLGREAMYGAAGGRHTALTHLLRSQTVSRDAGQQAAGIGSRSLTRRPDGPRSSIDAK